MITLPKSLKVTRDLAKEREVVQRFRDKVESFTRTVDSPIHMSDLLNPMKAYWERMSPKKFSDETIMFFSMGYAGHEFLLGQDDEGGTQEGDVIWSPDKREKWGILEVKITTKKRIATTIDALQSYLEQLCGYLAFEDVTVGEILIWYMGFPSHPKLVVFRVEVSKEDCAKYKKKLLKEAKMLRTALTKKDPSKLRLCEKTYCYRSKCHHYDECKPEGRWKPPKTVD